MTCKHLAESHIPFTYVSPVGPNKQDCFMLATEAKKYLLHASHLSGAGRHAEGSRSNTCPCPDYAQSLVRKTGHQRCSHTSAWCAELREGCD